MRFVAVWGASTTLLFLSFSADAQNQDNSNPKCSNGPGLFSALGLCVQDPATSTDAQAPSAAPGSGSEDSNLADEFYVNPTKAMVAYATYRRASIVFEQIDMLQGWYHVSFHQLPSSVARLNAQQVNGTGMNNFYQLTQGPNRFNSTYEIHCLFPPSDGSKIASVQVGQTR